MPAPARHVAFLRGINVGRNKRIAMVDLRALTERLGHTDVATHLQSGNVVFTAGPRPAGKGRARTDAIARGFEDAIRADLGLEVGVVVRTRAELAAVLRHDPIAAGATDPAHYLVSFLSDAPSAEQVARLAPAASDDERLVVHGREAYLWLPGGINSSKLALAAGRLGPPGGVSTARNWNTVTRLLALLDG